MIALGPVMPEGAVRWEVQWFDPSGSPVDEPVSGGSGEVTFYDKDDNSVRRDYLEVG